MLAKARKKNEILVCFVGIDCGDWRMFLRISAAKFAIGEMSCNLQ